jgi:hydrogenase maturation protease
MPEGARAGLVVIGVGNLDCGDDGVGRLVARLLRGREPPGVRVEEQDGGAVELIDVLVGAAGVFLVDAAVSGAPAGTVHMVDCRGDASLPSRGGASSHGLGVAEGIGLARALGSLPPLCRLYAVEGAVFAPGAPMSPAVASVAEVLAARLARDLREARR